jgi:hypothetical protein
VTNSNLSRDLKHLTFMEIETSPISSPVDCQATKMLGYIFALLPLYVLVYLPLSHILYGSPQHRSKLQSVSFNSSFIATDEPLVCPEHNFNTHILSHEPLMIYIEDFLSASESKHLLQIRYSRPRLPHQDILRTRVFRSHD